jgi:hypothetical protein
MRVDGADNDAVLGHLREVVSSAERVQGSEYGSGCVAVSWALIRALRLGGDGSSDGGATAANASAVGEVFAAAATKYLSVKNSPLSSQVCLSATICMY